MRAGGPRGPSNLQQRIIPPFLRSHFLTGSPEAAVHALSPSDVPGASAGIQLAGGLSENPPESRQKFILLSVRQPLPVSSALIDVLMLTAAQVLENVG